MLLLALPSLHGSAGVWQFPAYGPSPRPLEAPTPRVARAAIPKDLVSGIAIYKPTYIFSKSAKYFLNGSTSKSEVDFKI